MDIFEYGNSEANIVLIQPLPGHQNSLMESELALIRKDCCADVRMIAIKVDDWNGALSPWEAPAISGGTAFAGRAADTLCEIEKLCDDKTKRYYIGGYSLAGLFALWAAYRSDRFCGVAAASPSVWFPGFLEFMQGGKIKCSSVYLSLGNREEKVRNPQMSTVGCVIRAAYELLGDQNINCTLEWNEGNHFRDVDRRTAKAFSWLLS